MSTLQMILLILLLLRATSANAAHDCLLASDGNRPLPNFNRSRQLNGQILYYRSPIQAIATSYRFNCCGVITEWRAFMDRRCRYYGNRCTITFQVWRPNSPSPVDTDGCYTLIGANTIESKSTILLMLPSENQTIEVQPGDVVGFNIRSRQNERNIGVQFARDSDNNIPYRNETVWFATDELSNGNNPTCPYPVGLSGTLRSSISLAPLITASLSIKPCPSSTSHKTETHSTKTTVLLVSVNTSTPIATPSSESGVGAGSAGMVAGSAVAILALVIILVLITVVILTCVIARKRKRKAQQNLEEVTNTYSEVNTHQGMELTNQTAEQEEVYYDTVTPTTELSNEYSDTDIDRSLAADEDTYYYVNDPSNDPTIPTSRNASYGDITTTAMANDDQHYYSNEELNDSMIMNETYGKVQTTSTTSYKQENLTAYAERKSTSFYVNYANHSSIPTTENEAYTSVSANTDGMETEETYDYVRNL